jgi:post-segregation antitoxin (ccd killing protein)
MVKRKISVTVDEELLELANESGTAVSTLVNAALGEHLDRLARRAALGELLQRWESALGPVDEQERADAQAAFAEVDGVVDQRASA